MNFLGVYDDFWSVFIIKKGEELKKIDVHTNQQFIWFIRIADPYKPYRLIHMNHMDC